MQKSLFWDTHWKAWPLGLFFSTNRTRWSEGIFEGSQLWKTRFSMPGLKQNKAQCMPYIGLWCILLAPCLCWASLPPKIFVHTWGGVRLRVKMAKAVSLVLLLQLSAEAGCHCLCGCKILHSSPCDVLQIFWNEPMCRFANHSYEPLPLLAVYPFRAMAGNWLLKVMKFGGAEWEWIPIRDAGYPEWPLDGWRVWVCAASGISVFPVLCLRAEWRMTKVCSCFQG